MQKQQSWGATKQHSFTPFKSPKNDMETKGEEPREKQDRTCMSPLVSLQLVRARELPSAVCELALVGLLACTGTHTQTYVNVVEAS